MEFSFHVYNTLAGTGAAMALKRLLGTPTVPPVVLCVGSDLAIGDSLGPLTGTLLRRMNGGFEGYVYGTLRSPVTAKEIKYLRTFLRETHPGAKIIAVDAAVGEPSELGLVKFSDAPLRPGLGANKRLDKVGDISVLGIVAQKGAFSYAKLNLTRLGLVYGMAETIARAISEYLAQNRVKNEQLLQNAM